MKRDSAELASKGNFIGDRRSDSFCTCYNLLCRHITASRFMMSSNSIVSSMSMTVSSPTWEGSLMPG